MASMASMSSMASRTVPYIDDKTTEDLKDILIKSNDKFMFMKLNNNYYVDSNTLKNLVVNLLLYLEFKKIPNKNSKSKSIIRTLKNFGSSIRKRLTKKSSYSIAPAKSNRNNRSSRINTTKRNANNITNDSKFIDLLSNILDILDILEDADKTNNKAKQNEASYLLNMFLIHLCSFLNNPKYFNQTILKFIDRRQFAVDTNIKIIFMDKTILENIEQKEQKKILSKLPQSAKTSVNTSVNTSANTNGEDLYKKLNTFFSVKDIFTKTQIEIIRELKTKVSPDEFKKLKTIINNTPLHNLYYYLLYNIQLTPVDTNKVGDILLSIRYYMIRGIPLSDKEISDRFEKLRSS
jgi:hypothetical protein